jgi:hypothetical protein
MSHERATCGGQHEQRRPAGPLGGEPDAGQGGDYATRGAVMAALTQDPQPALKRVVLDEPPRGISDTGLHLAGSPLPSISTTKLQIVSRRLRFLGLLPVFLFIGGCGGSSHSTSPTTATAPIASTPTSATGPTKTATTTTSTSAPTTSKGGSSNVRVPATFVLKPNGQLSPPQISVPSGFTVQVTVAAADRSPHNVLVAGHSLRIFPGGRASTRLRGLPKGHYVVKVDGRSAGVLVVGVQPGP